ncbi:MAG TPA: aminomethyltransferase family protein [Candidatus Acidoferrales bacterium]|nr:aminomethyltransferase family protein [Candidatus Acidoferrales bacterium]
MSESRWAELHRKLGATLVHVDGTDVPEKYTSVEEEYSAARRHGAFFDISHFGKLRLTGRDSLDLLNRISTNDLSGMRPGMGKQTFLATEKGRVVDLCTVYTQQESLLLRTSPTNSGNVKRWIEKFIVSEDVKVEDVTGNFPMIFVTGPSAPDFLKLITRSSHKTLLDLSKMPLYNFIGTFLGSHEVFLSRTRLALEAGYVILVNGDDMEFVWNLLLDNSRTHGVVPAGLGTFEILRIEAGTPLYPSELNENVNPLEVNNLEAVSFTKGCYVGQEVVARLQTYDKVRRRLVGLITTSKVHAGSKVIDAKSSSSGVESEVGFVTSSIRSPGLGKEISLAYVSMQQVVPGSKYFVKVGGKNIEAELSTLPFMV